MRVVIAHKPPEDIRPLRECLSGAGFQCDQDDCVPWNRMAECLASRRVDLVVIRLNGEAATHQHALHDALMLTSAPTLAVGKTDDTECTTLAKELGISELVDERALTQELDQALQRLRSSGVLGSPKGRVLCVVAPAPGSGGTTVAAHLSASLAHAKVRTVTLLELSREHGDLGVILDLDPRHTAESVCQRWQKLDQVGLRSSLYEHTAGFRVLANAVECQGEHLTVPAVRRIITLSRFVSDVSVIALGGDLSEEALTAMRLSDQVLVVVRPDVPALRRARRFCEQATQSGIDSERLKIIVNRWGQRGQLKKEQIEAGLNRTPFDFLPEDPSRVNRAANEGKLVHELARRSGIVSSFHKLAANLMKEEDGRTVGR